MANILDTAGLDCISCNAKLSD